MPIKEFECQACRHRFEEILALDEPVPQKCPKCGGGPLRQLLGTFRIGGVTKKSARDADIGDEGIGDDFGGGDDMPPEDGFGAGGGYGDDGGFGGDDDGLPAEDGPAGADDAGDDNADAGAGDAPGEED